MTREEAIVVLQKIKPIPHRGDGKSVTHTLEIIAIDKAIKALEQQPSDDCISREAVDEYITNLLSGYLYDEERTRLEDLTAYIWELPSVTPKAEQKWIPCEERLPEEGGDYLVTTKWKGSYSGDTYIETNMAVYREKLEEWDCKDVIAWMPLPEPYKAESEDKPKGRWIDMGNEGLVFKCSICGTKKTIESHYCPNCGARMEV